MIINSRKYSGSIGKSWTCELIEQLGSMLVFKGVFDHEIKHEHLGVIRRGTMSHEYYWLDRWFNVFRFHEPDGAFRNYYCNINMPPTFVNDVLNYIDLDIDIMAANDGTHSILDSDEFEENALKYNFSDDLRKRVSDTVAEVITMIKLRQFPFELLNHCNNTPQNPW